MSGKPEVLRLYVVLIDRSGHQYIDGPRVQARPCRSQGQYGMGTAFGGGLPVFQGGGLLPKVDDIDLPRHGLGGLPDSMELQLDAQIVLLLGYGLGRGEDHRGTKIQHPWVLKGSQHHFTTNAVEVTDGYPHPYFFLFLDIVNAVMAIFALQN